MEQKQFYGRFNRLISNISYEKNIDVAKKTKPLQRNRISPNSSTKQRNKDQSYQSKN